MYRIEELYKITFKFRKAIIASIKNGRIKNRLLIGFPNGCCTIASDLLQHYLLSMGIETYEVSGRDGETVNGSHTWLEFLDGIVIDITYDQFDNNNPVYIGKINHFYKSLTKDKKIHCYNNELNAEIINIYNIIEDFLND